MQLVPHRELQVSTSTGWEFFCKIEKKILWRGCEVKLEQKVVASFYWVLSSTVFVIENCSNLIPVSIHLTWKDSSLVNHNTTVVNGWKAGQAYKIKLAPYLSKIKSATSKLQKTTHQVVTHTLCTSEQVNSDRARQNITVIRRNTKDKTNYEKTQQRL